MTAFHDKVKLTVECSMDERVYIKSLAAKKHMTISEFMLSYVRKDMSDHPLTGNWVSHRECHVKNDLLLIYKTNNEFLYLSRFGSHSELF